MTDNMKITEEDALEHLKYKLKWKDKQYAMLIVEKWIHSQEALTSAYILSMAHGAGVVTEFISPYLDWQAE